jgi:hypothetical protein
LAGPHGTVAALRSQLLQDFCAEFFGELSLLGIVLPIVHEGAEESAEGKCGCAVGADEGGRQLAHGHHGGGNAVQPQAEGREILKLLL